MCPLKQHVQVGLCSKPKPCFPGWLLFPAFIESSGYGTDNKSLLTTDHFLHTTDNQYLQTTDHFPHNTDNQSLLATDHFPHCTDNQSLQATDHFPHNTTDLETPVLYYYLDCEPSIVYNGQD